MCMVEFPFEIIFDTILKGNMREEKYTGYSGLAGLNEVRSFTLHPRD